MANVTIGGNPSDTIGDLPSVGSSAPGFQLAGENLGPVSLSDYAGKKVVLNIVPSVETAVCALSARTFNERASSLNDTVVITVSRDLPFALKRFCAAEGIDDVVMASGFRSSFGTDYQVTIKEGPFEGLYSRCIVIIDGDGQITYTEQVPEIGNEPDYDAAIAAL